MTAMPFSVCRTCGAFDVVNVPHNGCRDGRPVSELCNSRDWAEDPPEVRGALMGRPWSLSRHNRLLRGEIDGNLYARLLRDDVETTLELLENAQGRGE